MESVQMMSSQPAPMSSGDGKERVLVVDDEPHLREAYARVISGLGFDVEVAVDGADAARRFTRGGFDLVLSDVSMPALTGVQLLKKLRQTDLDVPVILVSGNPTLDSALEAVEHGATRYLKKPFDLAVLRETVRQAMRVRRFAKLRRKLVELAGDSARQIADLAGLEPRFDSALSKLFMAYQPIVRWSDRSVFAYEALVRSSEPTIPHPGALFDAAERLDRLFDLGRAIRSICPDPLEKAAPEELLFVNLHVQDLLDDSLYDPDSPLAKVSERVVLELTERARLEEVADVSGRVKRLRELGFRIAVDDIGAGYAGLTSFAQLEPDVVKLDMALVRDVHLSTTKQKLIGAFSDMCSNMGVLVVAEGVETAEERDALADLGCDLLQGFFFAKPSAPFVQPNFELH